MNDYLVFTWSRYYPCGGLGDLLGTAETLDEAVKLADTGDHPKSEMLCGGMIVYRPTMEIMLEWDND